MEESELPECLYYDDIPESIRNNFEMRDSDSEKWIDLYSNTKTKQFWVIDSFDKYHWQVAIKISDVSDWKHIDYEAKRKRLLLESRGGLTDEKCTWQGCNNKRVKGVFYCIDHLYKTGAV